MQFDPALFERARCTEKEKADLLPMVRRMVGLSEKATNDGILALGNSVEESDPFTAQGLQQVMDGVSSEKLQIELLSSLMSGNLKGKALLERMLVSEGVMCIQHGIGPTLTELKLLAYLGEKIFFSSRETAESK